MILIDHNSVFTQMKDEIARLTRAILILVVKEHLNCQARSYNSIVHL